MSSTYLKHKTKKQIEEFAANNKFVYPIILKEFLGCTYKTSIRIIQKIKKEHHINTKYIESSLLIKCLYEQI